MPGTYLETVILYCLNQINGERSFSSIYHLLTGKKSSQTIQDAHLFQLDHLFQTFHFLSRDEFDKMAASFSTMNWIKSDTFQHYCLTDEGNEALRKQLSKNPIPKYLNGWGYHSLTFVFWERISLLVQVCSNLVHQHFQYIPIQRKSDTQTWLKNFLQKSGKDREKIAEQLHNEMVQCFDTDPNMDPIIFVIRLTGYDRIGLTSQQAADFLKQEYTYYHLQFLNLLHFMIKIIITEPNEYKLLYSIISDQNHRYSFTLSTRKTYELLKKGLDVDKIAEVRTLKRSTIEDHIVEIAIIDPGFDITPFVQTDKQKMILLAAKQTDSKQLKQIRELASGCDYFEIRLVMAKFGESKWI